MTTEVPKILIVDDLEANRVAVKRLLEDVQVEVIEAVSCADALRQVLRHSFRAILMDVRMPKVDGFKTAEILGAYPDQYKAPIIFLTGDSHPDSIDKGYRLGGVDYITRPYNEKIFLDKITALIEFSNS